MYRRAQQGPASPFRLESGYAHVYESHRIAFAPLLRRPCRRVFGQPWPCSGCPGRRRQESRRGRPDHRGRAQAHRGGQLIVGSDCDYPPFTYLDGEKAAGFEFEILTAICDVVGLECEYHSPLKFDTLCALVATGGTVDVAVSAITIDPEREDTVDFTDPYFDSNQSVTVLKDSGYASVDDLEGKNIAVQSGTTGEAWAKENISGATVTAFDEAPAALAALQAGKADAVVIDLPVAVELLESSYDTCEIIEAVPTGEQYGIAVSKENPGLTELLNIGLKAIQDDGTYQEIYDKYFTVDDEADDKKEEADSAKDDGKKDEKAADKK